MPMGAPAPAREHRPRMPGRVWVAHDDGEEAGWALQVGVDLARRTHARLTLVHVARFDDEPVDCREGLAFDLLGLSAAARARARLNGLAAELGAVVADVRVATGPVADTLLVLLDHGRPDVVVAGSRPGRLRQLGPRVGRALAAAAPCPVILVRRRPARAWSLVVTGRERWSGVRAALGLSSLEAVLDATAGPVLVAPRTRRSRGVLLGRVRMGERAPSDAPRRRPSLLVQLFAANALVLLLATLALILGPVSVSRHPVVAEVLVVGIGLAVMLGAHLLLLRRTLAPLRLLTEVMGAIDLRRPGRRLPDQDAAAELVALAAAFNGMLSRLEEERRDSARRALAAQEQERIRIARELHDQVGQTLTAVTIQAERAAVMEPPDRATLERIAATALQSLDDVRRIGRELRPEALDDLGLGNALITLVRRMGEPSEVRIAHELEAGLPQLSPEAELVIYRIAQEAITNALRHAEATRVTLSLRAVGDAVELRVVDDGRGMPDTRSLDTAGLAGMRERAMLIGAELQIDSRRGAGTSVRVAVPVARETVR